MAEPQGAWPVWHDTAGKPLSCRDKIKVLNENLDELKGMAQDALEDAILMGADEAQIRATLARLVDGLTNPYRDRMKKGAGA